MKGTPVTPRRLYPLEEALKAQKSLRDAAGLAPEQFPIQAFVGMISDEIEALRDRGKSDSDIATIIQQNSSIKITASDIYENYASPEQRHQPSGPSAQPVRFGQL